MRSGQTGKIVFFALALTLLLASVTLGACGSSSDSSSTGTGEGGLPSSLASGLKVGMDISFPPMEFYENGDKVAGVDPEVAEALADQLGVPLEIQNIGFESLVTSLQSNRISTIISAMKDTQERQQKLNMIDYFNTKMILLVKKGNPEGFTDLQSLCGHTAGQVAGTATILEVEKASEECESGSINILSFNRNSDVNVALLAGRVEANLDDAVSLEYVARTAEDGNAYETIEVPGIASGYMGIATEKSDPETTEAIAKAYKQILADGTLAKIYKKWHMPQAVPSSFLENEGTE